jgi:hypothetical protein
MTLILTTLAVAFAAFCVWLTVRIVNRRENSDHQFLATVCVAVLLLLLVIAPSIGLYSLLRLAILPKSGAAKTMPVPPPVQPSGR